MTTEEELYSIIPRKDYNDIKGLAYKIWVRSFAYIALDDLIQEGVLAYLKEKKKYDKSKNDYFMGYAYKRVRGAMLDYVAKNSVDKHKTVRKPKATKTTRPTYVVPAPENVEQYHITDENEDYLLETMFREEIREAFFKYISNLTELEQFILFSYFVRGRSMIELEKNYNIARLKIKAILVNCVSYLRRKFNEDFADEKDINLMSISKGGGVDG